MKRKITLSHVAARRIDAIYRKHTGKQAPDGFAQEILSAIEENRAHGSYSELSNLLDAVCFEFGVQKYRVLASSRKAEIVQARATFVRRAYEKGAKAEKIAAFLGKDRTSILYYLNYQKPFK